MDETYQRALDEYKEICSYHRTEDQLKWQVLGIAYGGSALLAATAFGNRYSYASVAVAGAAAAAAALGTAVYIRLSKYTNWRLERAWELEESLRFNHHRLLRERHAAEGGKNAVIRIVGLGVWLPWALWAAYFVSAVAKH